MVGTTVGKYRVVERLGRGGMGTVYKAVDETLDRHVAIKVLNPEFGDGDVLRRFRAEAVTLARLNHPGIATIYELHRQHDELMMVMEFVRGETFHDLADRVGPLDPPQAAHLCIQVLDALGHAHRAGVIHRDLKPANLMIGETGAVKVMDFGIARVLGTEQFTLGGLMMGTPAYMAPEQVMGQVIDTRADLYAVGVVFYRLLAGRLPFVADTAIAMAQKQISEQPTPLADLRPDLPAWCSEIAVRALAKDPAQRFQTAEEFRVALTSAVIPQSISELPTLATPALGLTLGGTPRPRTRDSALDSAAVAFPITPPPRERTATTVVLGRTHLAAIAAVFVVLAAGIVLLAFAALRRDAPNAFQNVPSAVQASPPQPGRSGAIPPTDQTAGTSPPPASRAAAPSPAPPLPPQRPSTPPPNATSAAAPPVTSRVPPAPSDQPPDATVSAGANLPVVAFGNVRVLHTEGGKARERRGILRVGGGEIAMAEARGPRTLIPLTAIKSLHYSRSRQPRWRDEDGKEVGSRVDLGPLGFFRSERNWLILTTAGEPVILSVENPQLRNVVFALETRTGLTVRRFNN